MNTNVIPARSLQKSYKSIINMVRTGNQVMILTTNSQPQAAIVSLEDLEKIQRAKAMQASLDLLELAIESREELKKLPKDLRAKANDILYSRSR